MDSPQLPQRPVRIYRALRLAAVTGFALLTTGCTTLPAPRFSKYAFPKNAYIEPVSRPYEKLGIVRSKVNYPTLDPGRDEDALCKNYFNKAVEDLVKMARKKGADAVIEVRSVVFYEGMKSDTFPRPECADDGEEGQVLAQGLAVKWTGPEPEKTPTPESGEEPALE